MLHTKFGGYRSTGSGEVTLAPFARTYRVTDEALIAQTMVWPNFFLMDVLFSLNGSKRFIIILPYSSVAAILAM